LVGLFGKGPKDQTKKQVSKKKSELKKLVKDKKYNEVLKLGAEILAKTPDDLDVLFILGSLFYMQGKLTKSISYFEKVLEISSYDPEALLLKADALFKLGKYEDSTACCNKIQEIDPKNKGAAELLEKMARP